MTTEFPGWKGEAETILFAGPLSSPAGGKKGGHLLKDYKLGSLRKEVG